MTCPNCDKKLNTNYCYDCGYTASNYNYLADRISMEGYATRLQELQKAHKALHTMYRGIKILDTIIIFPVNYIDADRIRITANIRKINNLYHTNYGYRIEVKRERRLTHVGKRKKRR